ncbi:unnamed protein product [Linum trigynum]|uniref:Uncharacterized protein n=1 Tax=Linum trigynum TaxID=586398 RepID=A0AAV2DI77_9ROSI
MVTCSFAEVSDLRLGTWHLTLLLQRGAWHHTPLARCLTFSGVHGDDSFSQAPSVRGRLEPHSFSQAPDTTLLQRGVNLQWAPGTSLLPPGAFSQAPNLEWEHGDSPLPRCLTFG